jgi:tetratricopeptide (TPR) repeat protein
MMADRFPDARERLREAVETFTAAGDHHSAARAAASLGVVLWNLDRSDEALETLRPAFDALVHESHDVEVGKLAAEIARIEFFAGEADRAREHIELAIDIAEEHDDPWLISNALNTKSLLLRATRPHERRALLREALLVAEEHDLTEPMLRAINNLVVFNDEVDRPDEAEEFLRRGIELARARGHRGQLTWFTGGLVTNQAGRGEWEEGLALAGDVFGDEPLTYANTMTAALFLAKACWERGEDDDARGWLGRLPAELAESGDRQNAGIALFGAAVAAMIDRRLPDAIAALVRVWKHFIEIDNLRIAVGALGWGANAAALLGDRTAALPLLELYEASLPPAPTRVIRVHLGRLRGWRAAAAGDEDTAADAFADALAAARSLGRETYLLAVLLAEYGAWLVDCGRSDDAAPLLDEAVARFEPMGASRWLAHLEAIRADVRVPA